MVASDPWQWNSAWQRNKQKTWCLFGHVFIHTLLAVVYQFVLPLFILHVVEIGPLWTLCRDSCTRLQNLHPSVFPMQKVEQAAKNATAPYYCSRCFYFNTLWTFVSSKHPSHLKESYEGRWIKSRNDTTRREINIKKSMVLHGYDFRFIHSHSPSFRGSPATPYTSSP